MLAPPLTGAGAPQVENPWFKWFGSIGSTPLLSQHHLLVILISHLKYLHFFYIISNISFQRFMFQISKHYLCICNCRLKHSMSIWAALNSVSIHLYASSDAASVFPLHCKDTFCWYLFHLLGNSPNKRIWLERWFTVLEKKWLKGKNGNKTYWNISFFITALDHTEYEEYQNKCRSQLSAVIFKKPAQ